MHFKNILVASKRCFNTQGLVLVFKLIYPRHKKTFCLFSQIIDSWFVKILNTMLYTLKYKTPGELTHVPHGRAIPSSASTERLRGAEKSRKISLLLSCCQLRGQVLTVLAINIIHFTAPTPQCHMMPTSQSKYPPQFSKNKSKRWPLPQS